MRHPECLWTVIVINSHSEVSLETERLERLTPLAQYFRAITACLPSQREHGEAILETLKELLTTSSDDDLFDDEDFTKSRLYHSIISTSHELVESITLNLNFMRRLSKRQLSDLCKGAHIHEKSGLVYWRQTLVEEVQQLQELRLRVSNLGKIAQERVRIFCELA